MDGGSCRQVGTWRMQKCTTDEQEPAGIYQNAPKPADKVDFNYEAAPLQGYRQQHGAAENAYAEGQVVHEVQAAKEDQVSEYDSDSSSGDDSILGGDTDRNLKFSTPNKIRKAD